jgi:hypothetical protein
MIMAMFKICQPIFRYLVSIYCDCFDFEIHSNGGSLLGIEGIVGESQEE